MDTLILSMDKDVDRLMMDTLILFNYFFNYSSPPIPRVKESKIGS